MSKIAEKLKYGMTKVMTGIINGLSQSEEGGVDSTAAPFDGMPQLIRQIAAEGAVLLKNKNCVLPISKNEKIAVFGRVQMDYFYVGYGSGGNVKVPYKISLADALKNENFTLDLKLVEVYEKWIEKNPAYHGYWGHWPMHYPEMPLSDEEIKAASKQSQKAIIVIGRAAGEDRENTLSKGSFYLTADEERMIKKVGESFKHTIVLLNIGNIIDMSWTLKYKDILDGIMIVWQGGMESGNAVADLLCGAVTPSGKLTDTIAINYDDYPSGKYFGGKKFNNYTEDIFVGYRYFETFNPDAVLFPFGYGLSYTNFAMEITDKTSTENKINISVNVKNTGNRKGKEICQIYCAKPQGKLGKPLKELVAFDKTRTLEPDESETLVFELDTSSLSSYDDSGKSGHKSCYVLEEGEYFFYVGNSVRNISDSFSLHFDGRIVKELTPISPIKHQLKRFAAITENKGNVKLTEEILEPETEKLREEIISNLPKSYLLSGDKGYKLSDVAEGKIGIGEFVAQLSKKELEALTRGDYTMNSPLGTKGNGGVFGGVLQSLRDKGIMPIITTDGPSGIRLSKACSLLPMGTLLACSYNLPLVTKLYALQGEEMKEKGSDVLLAPGMNIHRNVLCGRNFEYYSEDPLVSGKTAAAAVIGLQQAGVAACPKHFACNNQETRRNRNDSRLSERALREIYLKAFEICVKEGKPKTIMTSYNKINGVWGHYNYHLCTSALRKEWGYQGMVMTDWWMQSSHSPEFPKIRNNAYRVRAQVDLLMPGGNRLGIRIPNRTLLKTLDKRNGITLGELQRSAINILNCIIKLKYNNK